MRSSVAVLGLSPPQGRVRVELRGINERDLGRFYSEFQNVDLTGMLEVVRLLRQTPWQGAVYTLTSHAALVLLAENHSSGTRWVTIDPWRQSGYEVRYRLPDSEAPWPETQCGGIADTPERAVQMAVLGMRLCRAWEATSPTSDPL